MPDSDNKPQIIRKSNELIEARYKLSLAEQRLVLFLISEISPSDEDFKDYEIQVSELAKMFGLESDNSLYEKVQKAAESLMGQKIRLRDNKITEITTWFSYVMYEKGVGVVKLRFDKALKPYLLQLKSHFTQYKLPHAIDFKSQYSIRLYELLKMEAFKAIDGRFERTLEIAELRLILGIDKNDYPLFADFKKRAIEPAISEISNKTDLDILGIKYGKTGRKITKVTFAVTIRQGNELLLRQENLKIEFIEPKAKPSENHAIIDSLLNLGFSLEAAKTCKAKHGIKKIERNIAYTLKKEKEKVVKDVPAYLKIAIAEDWGGAWEVGQAQKEENLKQSQLKERQAKEEQIRKAEEQQKINDAIIDDFFLLPDEQRNTFIVKFLGTIGGIMHKNQIDKFVKLGGNVVRDDKIFRALFLHYLKNR